MRRNLKGQVWALVGVLACWACKSEAPAAGTEPRPQQAGASSGGEGKQEKHGKEDKHDGDEEHAKGNEEHAEHEHEELPRRLTPSPQVIADARIQAAPVKRERLTSSLALPGEIAADPDRTARISSPIAGRIASVKFREGARVRKGALLVSVQIADLGKLRAGLVAARAKAAAARSNAERLGALVDKGLSGRQELDNSRAEAQSFEAEARGLAEQLGVLGVGEGVTARLDLRAPIGGLAIERNAVIGQPVTPEQTLGTLADLTAVWFVARVFEKDLSRVRVGAPADVVLNAHPKEHFTGRVELIGRQVDPVARTVTARIRLKNREDLLRVGLFGTAHLELQESSERSALVVPRAAVTEIGGKQVVFVRHDRAFEVHDVVLGESAVGKVEILSGIEEGELVVVDGVFSLRSMVLRATLDHDEH